MSDNLNQLNYAAPIPAWMISGDDASKKGGWISRWLSRFLWFDLWTFLAATCIGIVVAFVYSAGGVAVAAPALVFILLMFPFTATAVKQLRRRRAAVVLGYIGQAVRLNQPLPRILAAAAQSETGTLAQRLSELRRALEAAMPLSSAITHAVPEMPIRAVGMIYYGERIGQLPQVLDRLVREEITEARRKHANRNFMLWYAPVLFMTAAGTLSFFSIFVLPKFKDICKDFDISLPAPLLLLSDLADLLPYVAMLIALILLVMSGFEMRSIFRRKRQRFNMTYSIIADEIRWWMPMIGQMQVDQAMGDISRALSQAVSIGWPLDIALHEAANHLEMNSRMQERIRAWGQGISAGLTPAQAAQKAGLPHFFAGMLSTAHSLPDQSAVFDFLARYYGSRFRRRQALLQSAVVPVVALGIGVIVALIGMGVLSPLTVLVDRLCSDWGKG